MTSAGLYHVLRSLLDSKTKTQAQGFLDQCGEDYLDIAKEVLARFKFERTISQNALLHTWFGQIAEHRGDVSAKQVKGELHQEFALDIRLRDQQFAWIWERTGALLSYEKQCSLLASETLGISSRMNTGELREYMNEIERTWRPKGVNLKKSEDKK